MTKHKVDISTNRERKKEPIIQPASLSERKTDRQTVHKTPQLSIEASQMMYYVSEAEQYCVCTVNRID